MPLAVLEIPNLEENIARPVAMEIARDVAARIGLPKDIDVRFIGTGVSLSQPNSTLDGTKKQRLPGDTYITLEVSEEYDAERSMSVAIFNGENRPIFAERKLGVYLQPVYQRVYNDIAIKVVSTDKTSIDNWMMTVKRRHSQRAVELLHEINYSWPIPQPFLVILNEIYKLRESNLGYNETIGEWYNNNFTQQKTVIANQAGNNLLFSLREKQIGVIGWFDFEESPPKPQRETDTGSWSVEFNYRVGYDRVESIVMSYPIMVHNQVLPDTFYDTVQPTINDLRKYLRYHGASISAMLDLPLGRAGVETDIKVDTLSIPYFDDWKPKIVPPRYTNICNILLQADRNNPNALLSLTQLGDWSLPSDLISFLKNTTVGVRSILVQMQNIIHIQLYRGNNLITPNDIIVSPELDLHYVKPLDEREVYHLSVSLLNDIRVLNLKTLHELSKYGVFLIAYLQSIYPHLATLRFSEGPLVDRFGNLLRLPRLNEVDGSLDLNELGVLVRKIPSKPSYNNELFSGLTNIEYGRRLVSFIFIIAEEMKNAYSKPS